MVSRITAQTVLSNLDSRSARSLKRTNATPGTRGAKGKRYFSVEVTLTAPKVRPWKELCMARMRCLAAGLSGASEAVRGQGRASFRAPAAGSGPLLGQKARAPAGLSAGLRARGRWLRFSEAWGKGAALGGSSGRELDVR